MFINFFRHLNTINRHKRYVLRGCFKIGLYRQGILHDLSKYSPTEFWVGVKYYQGDRSPNNAEREEKGYSGAWLHHKGRNKHHYEYWIDYSLRSSERGMVPAPMPTRYVLEMFVDRIAASKIYNGDAYTDSDPLDYYKKGVESIPFLIHKETSELLELLLTMLSEKGEEETFKYIREKIKK